MPQMVVKCPLGLKSLLNHNEAEQQCQKCHSSLLLLRVHISTQFQLGTMNTKNAGIDDGSTPGPLRNASSAVYTAGPQSCLPLHLLQTRTCSNCLKSRGREDRSSPSLALFMKGRQTIYEQTHRMGDARTINKVTATLGWLVQKGLRPT